MNETDLFQAWQARPCESTLVALLRGVQNSVYGLCIRVLKRPQDAEDAAQKVLLELLNVIPSLPSADRLRGWLYRASLLTSLSLKRSEWRRMKHERADRPQETPSLSEEERNSIHQHVADLEEDLRRIVVDYYFERRTLADLAGAARCSTGAVWKKLQKAHEALRRSLAGAGIATGMLAVLAFLESREATAAPADLLSPTLLSQAAAAAAKGRAPATAAVQGLPVALKIGTLSALVTLLGGLLLGYAFYRRRDSGPQEATLTAGPANSRKEARLLKGSDAAEPKETASPLREELVQPLSSSMGFWFAFCRAATLRDETARGATFRRLGLRRSDEDFRRACARIPWKRGTERWPEVALKNIIRDWMGDEPREAAAFVASLPVDRTPSDGYLNWTIGAALHEWSQEDPEAALAFVQSLPKEHLIAEYAPGIGYLVRCKADPEAFLRWFQTLAPKAVNWELIRAAVPRLAETDMAGSLEWVRRQPVADYRTVSKRMIVETWSRSPSWSQKCLDALEIEKDFHAAVSLVTRNALAGVAAAHPEWTTEMEEESERDIFRPLVMAVLVDRAGRDPVGAVRFVEALPSEAWTISAIDQVARLWSRDHPRDALTWLQRQPFPSLHSGTLNEILRTWTVSRGSDPQEVLEAVETLPENIRSAARRCVLEQWAECDPPTVARYCETLPASSLALPGASPEYLLQSVVAKIARFWSLEDPAAALEWVRKRGPALERDAAFASMCDSWADDLKQASSFLKEISNPALRQQTLERAVSNGAVTDPKAAVEMLREVPEPSSQTYEHLALAFAVRDPQAGLAWAQSLPPQHSLPLLQRIVIEATRKSGSVVVADWVRQSTLPQSLKQELLETLKKQGKRP